MEPGIKNSFFIKTFGCTFNLGDSLKIESILSNYDYNKVDNIKLADIVIINTCAVKHATETKILHFIQEQRNQNNIQKFIITGCLPQIGTKMKKKIQSIILNTDLIIKPSEINKIPFLIDPLANSNKIIPKADITPKYIKNQNIGIIQLSEGCNNSCTYCCTTIARGKLVSFSSESITNQIKLQYMNGISQFYLTSQDLGNYNYNDKNLTDLLKIVSNIRGNFQIRLGMLNPDFLIDNIDEFLPIFEDHRFYRFLHLPIQSGSNRILDLMKRNYQIDEVRHIIQKIQAYDPKFTFSTDVIVGFPTEKEEDFYQTYEFIEKWHPFNLNISKFSVRPNTKSKKMKQIPSQVIKQRSKKMNSLYQKYSLRMRKQWIGWEGYSIISGYFSLKTKDTLSRNSYHIPIFIKEPVEENIVKVKIKRLEGERLIAKRI